MQTSENLETDAQMDGMLAITMNIKILDTSKVDSVLILQTYTYKISITSTQNNLTLKNTGENMNICINCRAVSIRELE